MHAATWFPVFKLPPRSPLHFPPHPDLTKEKMFPSFPDFRHSLIHRFKRERGRFKKNREREREKKRRKRERRGLDPSAGVCIEETCCFGLERKLETEGLLNFWCKAGDADVGTSATKPTFNCRSQKAILSNSWWMLPLQVRMSLQHMNARKLFQRRPKSRDPTVLELLTL